MRILFLSPGAQLGGAERCLLDTLASLKKAEPRWQLQLLAGEDGPLLACARSLDVTADSVPFPPALARLGSHRQSLPQLAAALLRALPATLSYALRLKRTIARHPPTVIHSNGLKMHLLAAWMHRHAPVIWHLHDYPGSRGMVTRALQLSSSRCAGAIAVSDSVASDARRTLGPALRVKTILNAVDLANFHPQGPQAKLGPRRPGTVRVGLIATFARWKGHEVFLRALAHPRLRHLEFHAYVIGGPIYQTTHSQFTVEELAALARALDIQNRVTFTGFLSDSASAMRAVDIVVHASTAPEPFGLVIAESMACGRPVIASQSPGADLLVENGRTGIAAPPGDVEALVEALARLIPDGILRLCVGRAARASAELRFDRGRLGPAVSSFYREVLPTCESSMSTAEISSAA